MQNFLKRRKNKSFNYVPRYYQSGEHPFKIAHKLDTFRSTAETTRGLSRKLSVAMQDLTVAGDKHQKLRFLIIVAILVVAFLFIIDFEVSLFLNF